MAETITETPKKKPGRPKKVKSIVEQETPHEGRLQMADAPIPSVQNIADNCGQLFKQAYGSLADHSSGSFLSSLSTLNLYNPFLQNTRLKMISSLPAELSKESIVDYLKSPQFHEPELRSAAWSLSSTQYLYYKILRGAADIPLMKYIKLPPLLENASEYNSKKFKEDDAFVDEWLEKFDVVNTLKRVALEVKREGKSSYLVRSLVTMRNNKKHVDYAAFQKLPSAYTKLTAIGEHGFVASFNMMIFMNPAFSTEQYPEYIQQVWDDMVKNKVVVQNPSKGKYELDKKLAIGYSFEYSGSKYNSMLQCGDDKTYMFWIQLPQEICYTFCSDTSNAWVVPDTAGLFLDLQELTDYSVLAGLIASTPLTSLLTGEIELVPSPSAGRDQTAMNPETVLKFQNLFNSMTSTNTEAFFAPLKNLKLQSLTNVPNSSEIKSKAVTNFISVAGEGGNIIATEKPSIAQVKTANALSAAQYQFVVEQFRAALQDVIQNSIGASYRWKLDIFGDIFSKDSEKKFLKEMVAGGMSAFVPKLLAYENMTVRDSKAVSEYLKSIGFYDNLVTLTMERAAKLNEAVVSDANEESNSVGRPSLDDDEIESDETANSREKGENTTENKDVYSHNRCAMCGVELEDNDDILCESCREEYLEAHQN